MLPQQDASQEASGVAAAQAGYPVTGQIVSSAWKDLYLMIGVNLGLEED